MIWVRNGRFSISPWLHKLNGWLHNKQIWGISAWEVSAEVSITGRKNTMVLAPVESTYHRLICVSLQSSRLLRNCQRPRAWTIISINPLEQWRGLCENDVYIYKRCPSSPSIQFDLADEMKQTPKEILLETWKQRRLTISNLDRSTLQVKDHLVWNIGLHCRTVWSMDMDESAMKWVPGEKILDMLDRK